VADIVLHRFYTLHSRRSLSLSLSLSFVRCCTLSVIGNEFTTTRSESRARSLVGRASGRGRSARFNCGAAKRIKFSRRVNTRGSSLCDKFRRTVAKAGGRFPPRISIRLSALSGLRLAGALVLLTASLGSFRLSFPRYCSFCPSRSALLFKLAPLLKNVANLRTLSRSHARPDVNQLDATLASTT